MKSLSEKSASRREARRRSSAIFAGEPGGADASA
jgi:hypothetical protein